MYYLCLRLSDNGWIGQRPRGPTHHPFIGKILTVEGPRHHPFIGEILTGEGPRHHPFIGEILTGEGSRHLPFIGEILTGEYPILQNLLKFLSSSPREMSVGTTLREDSGGRQAFNKLWILKKRKHVVLKLLKLRLILLILQSLNHVGGLSNFQGWAS